MPAVRQRAAAKRDLIDHFVYLGEKAGLVTADRFIAKAEATFNDLATQPLIGAPLTLKHPDLAGLRKWRVDDFDNFLIFYLPRPDGFSIVRVLHATRDWWRLVGLES